MLIFHQSDRYPGCACDIPSHIYQVYQRYTDRPRLSSSNGASQFSWAKNPKWSQFYSEGSEILQYFKDVVDKFDLAKYIQLNHEITGAYWDSDAGRWNIHVKNVLNGATFVDVCDVFINNSGILK